MLQISTLYHQVLKDDVNIYMNVCILDIPEKSDKTNKRSASKMWIWKSTRVQHPVIDLKMELFVKIVHDFKL